jgi:hypothetical protein
MGLTVYTARVSYGGQDRFDVTVGSGGTSGKPFAPTWAILRPYLAKRDRGEITDADWVGYVEAYRDLMRRSYVERRDAWDALLARPEVTLVCFCTDPKRCHRSILAEILVRLGANHAGER